jgi:hypothetical protein
MQLPMVDRIACVQLAAFGMPTIFADEGAEAGPRRYLLHVEHFSNIQDGSDLASCHVQSVLS